MTNVLSSSDDTDDLLLAGVNTYRVSLNLTALKENDNADCLADEMANQYKDRNCTNTTGSNTVPGTEDNFSNYPQLLAHCDLNISSTRDGVILPACVPGLRSDLVLSNYTQSQYSMYLNSSLYVGAGIATENDWVVMILTTNTSSGDYAKDSTSGSLPLIQEVPLMIAAALLFLMY